MEYRDYYATLGIPREASPADIKKAFRKLARANHPDLNKGDAAAEQRFKEINEAHEVLSDPKKRAAYDQLGANWEEIQRAGRGRSGPAAGFGGAAGPGVRFEYRGNAEDLDGFSDFFQTFFAASSGGAPSRGQATGPRGGRRGQPVDGLDFATILEGLGLDSAGGAGGPSGTTRSPFVAPMARQDLEARVDVTLEEAYHGATRLVQVGDRRLQVTIPRGVTSGQRIRLSGTAGKGPAAGHVYLEVHVANHPDYTRRGADLQRELPVTLAEAVMGAEVTVPTLKGRVMLRIPPDTQAGRVFRLSGQGMPRFKAEGFGDLLVKVRVVLPTGLSADDRRRFKDFADHVHQPDPRQAPRPDRPSGARPEAPTSEALAA